MAVFYRKYQEKREGNKNYGKWYGRSVILNTVSTKDLASEISHATTVTYADVLAVLAGASEAMKQHLQNSQKVVLDGIGAFKKHIKKIYQDFDSSYFSYIFVIEIGSKMIRYEKKDISEIFGERCMIDGSFSWNIKSAIRFLRFIINYSLRDKNGNREHYDIGETIISNDGMKHILLGQNKVITLAVLFLNILQHKPSITTQRLINGMLFKTKVNADRTLGKEFVFTFQDRELDAEVTNLLNVDKLNEGKIGTLYDTISTKWTDSMNDDELNDFFSKFYFTVDYKELIWDVKDDFVDVKPIIDFRD